MCTAGASRKVAVLLAYDGSDVKRGTPYVEVGVAHHPWFPCEGRFPLRYPFIAEKPSETDVRDDPRYSCDVVCDGEVICDREVGLR